MIQRAIVPPASVTLSTPAGSAGSGSIITNASPLIEEPADLFGRDGYGVANVIRLDNKLATDVMSVIPSLPSLRTQFVNLWIDDGAGPVDYGLFTHVERVNDNYLEKRGWDDKGKIYKAEDFRFNAEDLSDILVDEDGEPLDEDRFETSHR